MTLLILADDLTGAADSAARCHQVGLPARIQVHGDLPSAAAGVIALSSDSRYLPAAAAATRVRALMRPWVGRSVRWYKKIDSTLRGNIGAELAAMVEMLTTAQTVPLAIVAPAFPAQGRGLVDGRLVFGQATSDAISLPALLAEQTGRPIGTLGLQHVRAGAEMLAHELRRQQAAGHQIVVVDALDERDLEAIVAAAQQAIPNALFCGSAGLVQPLARTLLNDAWPGQSVELQPGALLVVAGSGSQRAHEQLTHLRQADLLPCWTLTDPLLKPQVSPRMREVGLVLQLPRPAPDTPLEGESARRFVAAITAVAAELSAVIEPRILLLVGGDTAIHLLERLGIRELVVLAELLPGIPLLAGEAADGRRYQIITKAGNFGEVDTLVHLVKQGLAEVG